MPEIVVVRCYEDPGRRPGQVRVLVDRLWPRGVRRDSLDLDFWAKAVAPSTELRRWYGHDERRFEAFSERYRAELAEAPSEAEVARLAGLAATQPLVLLTATKDVEHSAARVLRDVLAGD